MTQQEPKSILSDYNITHLEMKKTFTIHLSTGIITILTLNPNQITHQIKTLQHLTGQVVDQGPSGETIKLITMQNEYYLLLSSSTTCPQTTPHDLMYPLEQTCPPHSTYKSNMSMCPAMSTYDQHTYIIKLTLFNLKFDQWSSPPVSQRYKRCMLEYKKQTILTTCHILSLLE